MSNPEEKSWLDTLSEILTQPLPGTEQKQAEAPPQPPVIHTDDEDDETLLDAITDILTQPLPGTEMPAEPETPKAKKPAESPAPEHEGEVAVRKATKDAGESDDPAITAGTAGADWMQREYERFNVHQERDRQRFTERQRYEQERFFEYQKRQLEQFSRSQQREQRVFRKHQKRRFKAWRGDMRDHWPHRELPPGMAPPPPPPPPPPPWWRKERKLKKRKGRGRGRGHSDD